MDFLSKEQVRGEVLDHLGIIAVTIEKLGLIEKIDSKLPLSKNKGSKASMGQRVSAMILNGLGFIDDRLYMFPDFLSNKPVERLFGDGMRAEYFNDDALGRLLDAIYNYGTTKLFTEVAFAIGIENNLLGKAVHFDTSTISVYGDYDEEENTNDTIAINSNIKSNNEKKTPINITWGYSKNKRFDLKQMVINLATTGAASFPVWMEAHSGNASDKTVLITAAERMKKFCNGFNDVSDFLYTGDSAFYENSVKHSGYCLSLDKTDLQNTLKARTLYLSVNKGEITFSVINNKTNKLKSGVIAKELLDDKQYNEVITYLSSNKKTLNSRIENIIFSGLSTLGYNKSLDMKWLSRVPSSISEAKVSLCKPKEEFIWSDQGNGYHITPLQSNYGGVKQRWILVYSEHAFIRESITLDRQVTKEKTNLAKQLRALSKEKFQCPDDAKKAAEVCIEKLKYHDVNFVTTEVQIKLKKWHAKNHEADNKIHYNVVGTIYTERRQNSNNKT